MRIRLEKSLRGKGVNVQKILEEVLSSLRAPLAEKDVTHSTALPHRVVVNHRTTAKATGDEENAETAVPRHHAEVRITSGDGSFLIRSHEGQRDLLVHDPEGKVLYEGPWNTDEDKKKAPETVRRQLQHLPMPPVHQLHPDPQKNIRVVVPERPGPVI